MEALGGMTKAIEAGIPKLRIEEAAARKQARIDGGQDVIVGVNKFQSKESEIRETLKINQKAVQQQLERLQSIKQERSSEAAKEALNTLKDAASSDSNLLPRIINAVQSYATLGEISDTLRDVFGEYH